MRADRFSRWAWATNSGRTICALELSGLLNTREQFLTKGEVQLIRDCDYIRETRNMGPQEAVSEYLEWRSLAN